MSNSIVSLPLLNFSTNRDSFDRSIGGGEPTDPVEYPSANEQVSSSSTSQAEDIPYTSMNIWALFCVLLLLSVVVRMLMRGRLNQNTK